MKYTTHKGKTYTVTTSEPCTITSDTGILLCTAEPGKQASFVAIGSTIEVDSEAAEIMENTAKSTKASGFNAGADIQFTGNLYKTSSATLTEESILNQTEGDIRWKTGWDTTPTKGSTNAVTSGGLYDLICDASPSIGLSSKAEGYYGTAIGAFAKTQGQRSTALGNEAKANGTGSVALGAMTEAAGSLSVAIGHSVIVRDNSTIGMGALQGSTQTIFYIIAAGSALANTYENGEACLGYVVKDSSGNISACGTRKLSELLTNNTAFAPASLDLDAPVPTPFLPTGISAPIELHQETEQ